jgi:hypothetical protein
MIIIKLILIGIGILAVLAYIFVFGIVCGIEIQRNETKEI